MPDHQPHPAAATGARARLLDRRVQGGYNRDDSDRLLTQHLRTLSPSALAYALHYDGFSTLRKCDADAAALLADEASPVTARTATPPSVADALIAAQLRGLEYRLRQYRQRVLIAWRNPLDDRGIRGLECTLVAAATLDRTASEIAAIQQEAGRA